MTNKTWEKYALIVELELYLGVLLATSISVKIATNLCELQS